MAGVDVGTGKKKRAVDSDINMVPFVDLLLVTVAFLLITAVWSHSSQLSANAELPGEVGPNPPPPERTLHVVVEDDAFRLSWRLGTIVESETTVPRSGASSMDGLRETIVSEFKARGTHQSESDSDRDRAVLHTPNDMPYGELVEVMDAVAAAKRVVVAGGRPVTVPAFQQSFAMR